MLINKSENPPHPAHIYNIPVLGWAANAGSYRNIPIDKRDRRAAEPLVKFADYGIPCESFYDRTDGGNWPYHERIEGATKYVWGRKTVAEMLVRVNARVVPFGVEIFVLDAYRPVKCQEGLWKFFWKQAKLQMPNATEAEQREHVLNFVSDPTRFKRQDSTTWPVHTSGGAVDLTLRDIKTKQLLDMGARFDEMSTDSYSDALEKQLQAGEIKPDDPRLFNRRLLHWAMTEEGFINYPLEFWHYDFGDQMYVLHAGLLKTPAAPQSAWYGYADAPHDA